MKHQPIEFLRSLTYPDECTILNREAANLVARHNLLACIDQSDPKYLVLRTTILVDQLTIAISTCRDDLIELAEQFGIPIVEHALDDIVSGSP